MMTIQDSFDLSQEDIESYRTKGFVVLRGLFTPTLIQHLQRRVRSQAASPTDPYQRGFDRLVYDTCTGDRSLYALLEEPRFRTLMRDLAGLDLFFTQGVGFSLRRKVSTGLAWHIESQSFGYQRVDDDAATLWTPLHPIRTRGQRGGVRYVPRSVLCGKFVYQQVAPAVFRYVEAKFRDGGLPFEDYVALRDGTLNNEPLRSLLEHHAEEDDFDVGDALLMSKYVIHRSVPLADGPLAARDAFAFRFIAASSRYDRERARDVEIPRHYYGYDGPTRFHLDVCQRDGERIVESPLFDSDRAIRNLGEPIARASRAEVLSSSARAERFALGSERV